MTALAVYLDEEFWRANTLKGTKERMEAVILARIEEGLELAEAHVYQGDSFCEGNSTVMELDDNRRAMRVVERTLSGKYVRY